MSESISTYSIGIIKINNLIFTKSDQARQSSVVTFGSRVLSNGS